MTGLMEKNTTGLFETSLEHLLTELQRLDLKLRQRVFETRLREDRKVDDEFRGLYISADEVDTIVNGVSPLLRDDATPDLVSSNVTSIRNALQELEDEIARRKMQSLRHGKVLRLHRLGELFHLTQFDIDALLVCLLPELSLKYERLYAYLQDDVTKKRPSIDLILVLLCPTLEQRLAARAAFRSQAPLMKHRLISLEDDRQPKAGSYLAKTLKVDEHIIDHLLGSDQLDARLLPFAELLNAGVQWDDLVLPDGFKLRLRHLFSSGNREMVCHFQGPYGVGRRSTAEAVCSEMGISLLAIDLARMLADETPVNLALELAIREASLQGAALYWEGLDLLLSENRTLFDRIIGRIADWPGVTFLSGEAPLVMRGRQPNKAVVTIEFPLPSHALRKRLWQARLDGMSPTDDELSALANKFRFTGGQICDAMATAANLALTQGRESCHVTMDDLYQACRRQSNQNLSTLARKIQPKYTWDDIVLPNDQMTQLCEIRGQVKYRHVVFDEWSFDRKVWLGKGLNVLFAGPSGTGKTMASEIIAGDLGLDLYRIDLSSVVSKYIGETEKNLDRIFKEGRDSNAILLFDEADALFGKRSEVRDSHDRYANIEISYLLQKMEEYEGMAILATNLRKNVDEAFARRMHFAIEFPFPEEHDRYKIWQRIFPPEAPLGDDVDLGFLARQFRVTGGNIKNIAVTAAFLAAAGPAIITMGHIIKSTKREYQKMGKLCTETDFARYFDLVKG